MYLEDYYSFKLPYPVVPANLDQMKRLRNGMPIGCQVISNSFKEAELYLLSVISKLNLTFWKKDEKENYSVHLLVNYS